MIFGQPSPTDSAVEQMARSHRLRPLELLPWIAIIGAYFVFPEYLPLGSQILIMILFALSLDLILGYAGIVSLGHAAFFGLGAYAAGLFCKNVMPDPLAGLVVAMAVAAFAGLLSSLLIDRKSTRLNSSH